METVLKKLRVLSEDDIIKKICGDRVFMNKKKVSVKLPYISYNPVITANPMVHSKNKLAELILEKYVTQINFYCDREYDFTTICSQIKKLMCENSFKYESFFIDATDSGDVWICFRFSITI